MPQTRDCDYCGEEIEPGTGTMFVQVNGAVTHYCSSKCEKNAGLNREPRDLEWTASGRLRPDASASPEPADATPVDESENGGEAEESEVPEAEEPAEEDGEDEEE